MTDGLALIGWTELEYPSRKEPIERVYLKSESGCRGQPKCHQALFNVVCSQVWFASTPSSKASSGSADHNKWTVSPSCLLLCAAKSLFSPSCLIVELLVNVHHITKFGLLNDFNV